MAGAWVTVDESQPKSFSTSEGRPIRHLEQWWYNDAGPERARVVRRYVKALAALLGGITPPVLIGVAHLVGWDLPTDTAVLLVGILSPLVAGIATWGAPANATAP